MSNNISDAPVDKVFLRQQFDDDFDYIYDQIIPKSIKDMKESTLVLGETFNEDDFDKIKAHAHSMKGSALMLGLPFVAKAFSELDTEESIVNVAALMSQALKEIERVERFLEGN